ncbi:MAG: two-component system NtrC family sensor kinase, partial [Paraglaciecola psychrophila]
EKMASLGQLVSGVAHEVNTPLGISITVVSLIKTLYKKIRHDFDQGSLDEEDFVLFLNEIEEGSILLERNLNNASALIRSFKKISVDQHADDLINIGVNAYIHDILKSIETTFKGTQISVEFAPGEEQLVNTYPGILTQILSNLFNNSHMHGFDNGTIPGKIRLRTTSLDENTVKIEYQDDGKGMSEDTLKNIFDPFFTTNRGSGGSGLGMNIVYNLVKHQLESELTISSKENEGMKFEFTLHELEKVNV